MCLCTYVCVIALVQQHVDTHVDTFLHSSNNGQKLHGVSINKAVCGKHCTQNIKQLLNHFPSQNV